MVDSTPNNVATDVSNITLITVPNAIIANTDSIIKQQISDIKTALLTISNVVSGLNNRINILEVRTP